MLCKFLYTGKTNQHNIPPIITNDHVLTHDTDKAEAFNGYFTSISKVDKMQIVNHQKILISG